MGFFFPDQPPKPFAGEPPKPPSIMRQIDAAAQQMAEADALARAQRQRVLDEISAPPLNPPYSQFPPKP